jgi:hypothetical protein
VSNIHKRPSDKATHAGAESQARLIRDNDLLFMASNTIHHSKDIHAHKVLIKFITHPATVKSHPALRPPVFRDHLPTMVIFYLIKKSPHP